MPSRFEPIEDPRLIELRAIRTALAGYQIYPPDFEGRQIDGKSVDLELEKLRSIVRNIDRATGQRTIIGHKTIVRGSNFTVVPLYVE